MSHSVLRQKNRQSGFTLLEAVVAIVILSTSGLAVYSWLSTSLDGLRRVNDTVALKQLTDDLDAYFHVLQVDAETDRRFDLNGYNISWTAKLVEPRRVGVYPLGLPSDYEFGLYDLDVIIQKRGRDIGSYQTRNVSYKLEVKARDF